MENFIEIDGDMLEGGGQILRNSAALSCLLKKPIKVVKIRAKRSKPGLRPQHLQGLQLIEKMCNGTLSGGDVESTEIEFVPHETIANDFIADTKTAGSICLLLQSALPCALFAPGSINLVLKGGTNAEMAPPIDHTIEVFYPLVKHFGINVDFQIKMRGYYPKGGGEIFVRTNPIKRLNPIEFIDRGKLKRISGMSYVAGFLNENIAKRTFKSAEKILLSCLECRNVPIEIDIVKENHKTSFGTGTGICIFAETTTGMRFGSTAIGHKGISAEKLGQDAAEELVNILNSGSCVDSYMQDQLIIYMALADGCSRILCNDITLHTETAIEIAKIMTNSQANFNIEKRPDGLFLVECGGIGLINSYI